MALMDKTALSVFIPQIWAKEILAQIRAKAKLLRLVSRNFEDQFANPGDRVKITQVGQLTPRKKLAQTPVIRDNPAGSTLDFLLNNHAYAAFGIEDIAAAQALPGVQQAYVNEAVRVVVTQMETDIFTSVYGSAGVTVGTAGTDLTEATILAARKAMDDANVPDDAPQTLVISTKDSNALMTASSSKFTAAYSRGDSGAALRSAQIGQLYGFDMVKSTLVPVVVGSPNATKNVAFPTEAVQFVCRPLPLPTDANVKAAYATDPDTGISVRVVGQYSIDDMALKVNVDTLYGVTTVRPGWVVIINS